jgi:uncharacterized protein
MVRACVEQPCEEAAMRCLIVLVMMIVLRVTTAAAQTLPSAAPTPEALAAAKEVMAVMSPDMVKQMMQGMVGQMWPQIAQSFGPKVDAATSAELRAEFERTLQDWVIESMKDMPAIYARYFTVAELHELAGFYKTPVGAKALAVMPRVMGDFSATMMPRMTTFQQQLQGRLQAILQKHGIQ